MIFPNHNRMYNCLVLHVQWLPNFTLNKRQRKQKGAIKNGQSDTLATLSRQDRERRQTTQKAQHRKLYSITSTKTPPPKKNTPVECIVYYLLGDHTHVVLQLHKECGFEVFDVWNLKYKYCGSVDNTDIFRHDYIDYFDPACVSHVNIFFSILLNIYTSVVQW